MLRHMLGKLVMETRLLAFLERLLGEPVGANDTVSVSSTQRARLVAWLNENSVPANLSHMKTNLIRIPDLLNPAAFRDDPAEKERKAPLRQLAATGGIDGPRTSLRTERGAVLGVGIDIQARSGMPETTDFRGDRFYSTNFSDRELGHCIQQSDPLMSLAGLWAAKEAILKAGVPLADQPEGLSQIEIVHGADGSPRYAGCLLSISHDQGVAVAVCIRLS